MTLRYGTAIVRTTKSGTEKIIDFDVEESYEIAARLVDRYNAKKTLPENIRWAVASIHLVEEKETEA